MIKKCMYEAPEAESFVITIEGDLLQGTQSKPDYDYDDLDDDPNN